MGLSQFYCRLCIGVIRLLGLSWKGDAGHRPQTNSATDRGPELTLHISVTLLFELVHSSAFCSLSSGFTVLSGFLPAWLKQHLHLAPFSFPFLCSCPSVSVCACVRACVCRSLYSPLLLGFLTALTNLGLHTDRFVYGLSSFTTANYVCFLSPPATQISVYGASERRKSLLCIKTKLLLTDSPASSHILLLVLYRVTSELKTPFITPALSWN